MKKLMSLFLFVAFFVGSASLVNAQSYKTGVGFLADFGGDESGGGFYGPHIKHMFNTNSGLEGSVLFADNATLIQGAYQYHIPISGAEGLAGYFGAGAGIFVGDGDSVFSVPFMGGLDYKVSGAPLSVSFDWRPRMFFFPGGDGYDGETEFEAGRFALGLRFTF